MKTQEEFFQTHAVDGVLDPELMAQMINLPEGDSGDQPHSGQPDPTPTPLPTPAPVEPPPGPTPEPTPEPVILAKDGVHTIAYEKLVEAREAEKAAKASAEAARAEAEALRQQLAAAQATPPTSPTPTAATVATPTADDVDFGDFSDEALRKGILEAVNRGVAAALPAKVAEAMAPLERRRQEQALTEHFETLYKAHPDMDAMLESQQFEAWRAAQPAYAQPAIKAVLEQGTASEVVDVLDSFVKATGKTAEPQPTAAPVKTDPAAAAAQAVAAAQAKPPTSLTEVPGSTAHHDEGEAMLDMSPTALMTKFDGKSPEQIEALLKRVL